MPNQISPEVQEQRSKKVIELSNEMQKEIDEQYLNKKVEVLFEEKQGEYYKGHTKNYMMVNAKSEEDLTNKIREVELIEIRENELIGKY